MDLETKLRQTLNPSQFETATHINGPAVVMAGAGSGKTQTLISRVSYLVDLGVLPERILMLTFTNAAADEMKKRASGLLDERCGKVVACTYHSFCNMMLRQYGKRIGLKDYSVLSYTETKNMIDYVKSSDPMFDNLKGFPSVGIIADLISMSINIQVPIKEIVTKNDKYSKYRDYWEEITILADKVAKHSMDVQKFTYDDLLLNMKRLLAYDDICKNIATRFQYIMVDEFQDTNNLQEDIIIALSLFNNNIVVVGDISQSIYAFRGANVKNIQAFHTKFSDCKTIVLSYNYRSTQEILDFANEVMQKHAKSWRYYDMLANDKHGVIPKLYIPRDMHKETSHIMDMIMEYHNKGVAYRDIAVLVRNSMFSFELESALQNENIKFDKLGGMKLIDYDCVGDMLAYFNAICNRHDLLSWYRILRIHPNIGTTFAKRIADNCSNADFLVENPYKGRKFYQELQLLDRHYIEFRGISDFMRLFDAVADFYFDVRTRACEESRMNEDSKEAERDAIATSKSVIGILRNIASKYDNIVQFIDDIVLDGVREEKDENEDRLMISTVHSAKGLEWKVVIVMDCVEDMFPRVPKELWHTEIDEEELRCFYVAITRAKDELLLYAPKLKMTYSGIDNAVLSHYVEGNSKIRTISV